MEKNRSTAAATVALRTSGARKAERGQFDVSRRRFGAVFSGALKSLNLV
jgi:hypothetical protein